MKIGVLFLGAASPYVWVQVDQAPSVGDFVWIEHLKYEVMSREWKSPETLTVFVRKEFLLLDGY